MLAACLALARPAASRADAAYASSGNDLLCANAPAGTVEKVPPPFDRWLVVVCAPQSQALVPVEGAIWFAHGTVEPVSILALPPAATAVPRSDDYNPGYGVRFKALYATEAKGAKRARAMKRLEAAMSKDEPPRAMPQIDRVFQLDAVSIIYDMRYNIYFYVANKRPRAAIACIDECRQALFFDILTLDEAKAKLSAR
jgi:hypothetical protein